MARTKTNIDEKIEQQKMVVSKAKDKYDAAVAELERLMNLNFTYRITYKNGKFYDRPQMFTVKLNKEDYSKIMKEIASGKTIGEIEGIDSIKAEMTELVMYADSWINLNGSQRTTRLKKPREVEEIEFFLSESEYKRIYKMKDPAAVFSRPEEHMTIYRNDGSSVTISTEYGMVKVKDSRENGSNYMTENDWFLEKIVR
jgi:hypothetical protein